MANRGKIGDKDKKENICFEKAVERLEQIVSQLDQNNVSLEQALAYFQEGIELVRHSNSLLNSAEAKVKVLLEDSCGAVAAEQSTVTGEL